MNYKNCINKVENVTIICKNTNHVIYPINRLRNLGLRKINGFVLDLDADILPQSISNHTIYNHRGLLYTSPKDD